MRGAGVNRGDHSQNVKHLCLWLCTTAVQETSFSFFEKCGGRDCPYQLKMLRAIHFSPLPCSGSGQGVAISTAAFMLPRFFVQTHIFSVSPSSFRL